MAVKDQLIGYCVDPQSRVEKMPTANFESSYFKKRNKFKVPCFQVYSKKCINFCQGLTFKYMQYGPTR